MTTTAAPAPSGISLPSYPWRLAHLAALWAFGVSQPVFSMLKGNPEFLVVRGSTREDVIVFALGLAFLPPLLVVLVELAAAVVSAMLSRVLHVIAVWCFAFLCGLQLVRLLEPERGAALLLPLVPAILIVFAYIRWNAFRSILSFSLVLPVFGVVSFVATVPLAIDDRPGADVAVRTNTPVVLVVLDEFPTSSLLKADGSLDAERYPNFARLAGDAVWYRRATTVHEFTTQAVPAVITGYLPKPGELPTLSDHPDNLFTLLGERYAFNVSEHVTRLCPSRYCPETRRRVPRLDRQRGLLYDTGVAYLYRVLPSALRVELPPIGDRWGGFADGSDEGARERLLGALDIQDVNEALDSEDHNPRTEFERFLGSIRRGEPDRTLHFLHVKLPHAPFRLLPSGREYGHGASIDGILDDAFNDWTQSQWLVNQALQRHLLQVGYTDKFVGLLLQRLKRAGIYDKALVVVSADHGASFEAGGSRRYVDRENVSDIAAVPLLVKYPGQRAGRVDRRLAYTTDIVPTIADVVGVDIPWRVDGRSLRGAPAPRRVAVAKRDGGRVVVDAEVVDAGVLATARRNARLFGEGSDSMYRIGPHPALLGRQTDSLATSRSGDTTARLDGETLFANVRLASGFVPARVMGEIGGAALPRGTGLAIAVNGRIAATTGVFLQDGRPHFAALVPETAFREGRNDVDVFAVNAGGGTPRLTRLGGTGRGTQYALSDDGRAIVLRTGERLKVSPGLEGRIESSTVEGATVRLRGWAADVENVARVDQVLVFAGRRLLFASETPVYRWTIRGVSTIEGLQRVGFVAELPVEDVRGAGLRAFAVRGQVATELPWPGGSNARTVAATTP